MKLINDALKDAGDGIIKFAKEVLGLSIADINKALLAGEDMLKSITENSTVTSVMGIIKSLALSVLVIFFLIELISKSMSVHKMTFEMVIMMLLKLVLAKILIENCQPLLKMIEDIGVYIFKNIAIGGGASDLGDMQGTGGFTYFFLSLFMFFFLIGVSLGTYTVIYGRVIELSILWVVAPIAIASFGNDQFKGTGKKFIQDIASIALQLPIIILIIIVMDIAQAAMNSGGIGGGIIGTFTLKSVMLSLITKSRSIATKITGG